MHETYATVMHGYEGLLHTTKLLYAILTAVILHVYRMSWLKGSQSTDMTVCTSGISMS